MRSFNYWLNVQKMRGRKPYQEAFLSSGKDIFETGTSFVSTSRVRSQVSCTCSMKDNLRRSGTSFTILYPTPTTNHGAATLGCKSISADRLEHLCRGDQGQKTSGLFGRFHRYRNLRPRKPRPSSTLTGGLIGDNLVATKKFLMTKQKEVKTKYTTNKETHQTNVRGNGDLLVRMVEFQHR